MVTSAVAKELAKVIKPVETIATKVEGGDQANETLTKLEGKVKEKDEQITKLEGVVAEKDEALTKLEGEKNDLDVRVKELEAEPAPAKGSLKVIAKGQDLPGTDLAEEPKTAVEAIKKAHQHPGFMNK